MVDPSRKPRLGSLAIIPTRIAGRYEPLAKIASGGMATVYLARSVGRASFRKLVAIKCVHPHMVDQPDFVEMFLDEARIASRIDHPNVCSVFDAGEDEGTHYIAMEYLHGEPLSALIRRWDAAPELRPPTYVELAARIIAEAAMGLHAAHELRAADGTLLGLVHRDISPQNLFLTYDGSVKVVDFGIAKAAGRIHETTTGVVKGKLAYMSPEQLRAEPLDRRSDVWALGVTLWELLTCRRLFKRTDQIATLHAVLDAEIDPPSELDPSVPPELDAIVMKALRRDPTHRQASARALADELSDFIATRGAAIGMSQVADLMVAAFAELKAKKDGWVQRSLDAKPGEPPSASDPPVEPIVSEVRPTQPFVSTEPVELPVKRTGPWLLVVAAALAAAAGVGAVMLFDEGSSTGGGPAVAATPEESSEIGPIPTGIDVPELGSTRELPGEPTTQRVPDDEPAVTRGARASRRRARSLSEPSPPPVAEPSPPVAEPAAPPLPPSVRAAPRPLRIVHPGGGWATVRIDGRTYGNTPTTIEGIAPGSHVIELQPYGQGEWSRHPSIVPSGEGAHIVRLRLPNP